MTSLIHFRKAIYPSKTPDQVTLEPISHDLKEEFAKQIHPKKLALYGERAFIYSIPQDRMPDWKRTGQLDSLAEMLIGDWHRHSLEVYGIATADLPMQQALVRETYPISPENLARHGVKDYTTSQNTSYNALWLNVLESVIPWSDYKGDFTNPEVLLPFAVQATKVKTIMWPIEL